MPADETFRRQLDRSLNDWVTEGLIAAEQRDRLRSYYHLDELPTAATSKFAAVLLSIGGLLIGLGLITFVAANWDAIPRSVRAIGVLMLTLGFNTAGFFWWTTDAERLRLRPRLKNLGSAMLLVGQLGWGASIALMAQWVQISGSPAGLFAVWGASVLAMAFGIQHVVSGTLGFVLLTIAAWVWQFHQGETLWLDTAMPFASLLVPFVFMRLAYGCRSRWLFSLGAIAIGTIWLINSFATRASWNEPDFEFLLSWGWCAALWGWSVIEAFQPKREQSISSQVLPNNNNDLQPTVGFALEARTLSVLAWSIWLWLNSFDGLATTWWTTFEIFSISALTRVGLPVLGCSALLIWGCLSTWKQIRAGSFSALNGAMALSLCLAIPLNLSSIWANTGLVTIAFNLILFGTACAIAWQGLQETSRWQFWLGLLALTLQILCRFFEYETGLLLKSLVLVVCGISVIAAGLQFERTIQTPSRLQN